MRYLLGLGKKHKVKFKIQQEEEKLNAISHGLGALLATVTILVLLLYNNHKTPYATLSIVLYSLSLIGTFTASFFYHYVTEKDLKSKLRIVDHISIYFLIAGTYSPVTLITLENGNGWAIFYIVWGIAFVGTIFKLFFTGKYEFLSLLLYLLMGWLIVLDFSNLRELSTPLGINLLFLGGAFYTAGIIFYAVEKIPYNHFIWHLFVLGGAISHWLFVFLVII